MPSGPPRPRLLFLSHHTRPGAMGALRDMAEQCAGLFDITPVFDQTGGAYSLEKVGPTPRVVTAVALEQALPYPRKNAQHPGTLWPRNIDLPLMQAFVEAPDHPFYWLIEYDVRYSGFWPDFFRNFEDNDSDLLAMTVYDHAFRPGWAHWASFESPEPVPLSERVRATLSFYRLSNRAMDVLDAAYRRGVSGHYEVTIPTVLKGAGLTIEDVGGDGAYVKPGNRNRFYTNSPGTPGLAPGTFVLHPEGMIEEKLPNMLWNPFKD
jgi:hypothetical protein